MTDVLVSSQVHLRSAERLRELCCSNRGTFIKVGQHLGALDYLLPEEYTRTLKVLHSQAPQSTRQEIEQVIREDLGKEVGAAMACVGFSESPAQLEEGKQQLEEGKLLFLSYKTYRGEIPLPCLWVKAIQVFSVHQWALLAGFGEEKITESSKGVKGARWKWQDSAEQRILSCQDEQGCWRSGWRAVPH